MPVKLPCRVGLLEQKSCPAVARFAAWGSREILQNKASRMARHHVVMRRRKRVVATAEQQHLSDGWPRSKTSDPPNVGVAPTPGSAGVARSSSEGTKARPARRLDLPVDTRGEPSRLHGLAFCKTHGAQWPPRSEMHATVRKAHVSRIRASKCPTARPVRALAPCGPRWWASRCCTWAARF